MHGFELILTLTGGLTAALVFGYLTHRLGLSPIVGYLLAGVAVGRHTPGFVADPALAEQLAEVGVVLLMFGVGLQLHIRDLWAVRRVVVPGAFLQIAISAGVAAAVARAFGSAWSAAAIVGVAVSVASTAVSVRVLADNRALHTRVGHLAVGWLVVEDVFAVAVLVLLPAIGQATTSAGAVAAALGLALVKMAALAVLVGLAGNRVIRVVLDRAAASRSRELFTLAVLVLAIGIAVGSAALFGVSMALGAFVAGIVVGRTDYGLRAASEALPMREAFGVLFFVSIGMLLDPRHLVQAPGLVLGVSVVVVVVTPLAAASVAAALGVPAALAGRVGLALGQVGEFSFILAASGRALGLLDESAVNTIVAVSMISIVANAPLHRLMAPVLGRLSAGRGRVGRPATDGRGADGDDTAATPAVSDSDRAVVVGYGPTGRALTRLLRDNGLDPIVIELNVETARRLREEGVPTVYGDAGYRETLVAAGVPAAAHLLITADLEAAPEVVRLAREVNPRLQVLARTTHLRDVQALFDAGADGVFSGEGEVALALTEAVLHRLGATPEQIDRERDRAHAALVSGRW